MMVKEVTKFHKCHLEGWDMLECVCVCVCRVSYRTLSLGGGGGGGTLKFGVDVERVHST